MPFLVELQGDEVLDFFDVVKKFEHMMKEKFNATMFNWTCLMNNSYKTKPYTPHLHWHCRPRYDQPLIFKNEEFIDPDFGNHYNKDLKRSISKETTLDIITAMQDSF